MTKPDNLVFKISVFTFSFHSSRIAVGLTNYQLKIKFSAHERGGGDKCKVNCWELICWKPLWGSRSRWRKIMKHHRDMGCENAASYFSILDSVKHPIPMAVRSKAWVCGRLLAGIAGSNPTTFVSVVCCQVQVSATGWSLVQRSPTECGVSKVWS
jgi:hypothetical protein